MKELLDLRNKIRRANKRKNGLSRFEECLLLTLTAQFLQKLAPFESRTTPLIGVGSKAYGVYVLGDF